MRMLSRRMKQPTCICRLFPSRCRPSRYTYLTEGANGATVMISTRCGGTECCPVCWLATRGNFCQPSCHLRTVMMMMAPPSIGLPKPQCPPWPLSSLTATRFGGSGPSRWELTAPKRVLRTVFTCFLTRSCGFFFYSGIVFFFWLKSMLT